MLRQAKLAVSLPRRILRQICNHFVRADLRTAIEKVEAATHVHSPNFIVTSPEVAKMIKSRIFKLR